MIEIPQAVKYCHSCGRKVILRGKRKIVGYETWSGKPIRADFRLECPSFWCRLRNLFYHTTLIGQDGHLYTRDRD